MKPAKIFAWLVIALMLLQSALATIGSGSAIGSNIDYGETALAGTATAQAFTLAMGGSDALELSGTGGDKTTNTLIFTSEAGAEGIYYKDGARTLLYGDTAGFTVLDKQYTLKHASADSALLSDSGITTGAYVLYTNANRMATGEDTYFNMAIFPDSGSNVKIKSEDEFLSISLPAGITFNEKATGGVTALTEEEQAEIETATAERASSEGAAPETEIGCHDIDEDGNPAGTASYVSDVRADGTSVVVPDYCAEEGSNTLYEASCRDGAAVITSIECPAGQPCSKGACRSGIITKFCIDSDRGSAETAEANKFKYWAQTKSNTVGFYAATEDGKEFGAWNDYCRDDKTLIEYYCSDRTEAIGLFREIICPKGCIDGACENPPYCYDTDGGRFENVKGKAKAINAAGEFSTHEDSCKDSSTVVEQSCLPNPNLKDAGRICEAGSECKSGSCIEGSGENIPEGSDYAPGMKFCAEITNTAGFYSTEIQCSEGKKCFNGKCTTEAPECNQCDALNKFNIKIGETCKADGTPDTFKLARCPLGAYCEPARNKCISEPLSAESNIIDALNRRKAWANLMDDASWWLERVLGFSSAATVKAIGESCATPGECASQICVLTQAAESGGKSSSGAQGLCADKCKKNENCVTGKTCSALEATKGQCIASALLIEPILMQRYDVSSYLLDVKDIGSAIAGMKESGPFNV